MNNAPQNNLRLVSLDGGGIRGFSQLEILRNIMHRLNWDMKSDGSNTCTLPYKLFDLIGGSGTGGLIAIFLTKLRMSVEEVSDEFCTITEEVYKQDGLIPSERTDKLRRCMEDLMMRRGFPIHMKLMDETQTDGCAGFVVVSLRSNIETKVCLRTYLVRNQPPSSITVVEAVLASCATQPGFAPVSFGERYRKREYVGAGIGANNPVLEVIGEAYSLFGGSSTVASLLSLGTGHPGTISWPSNGGDLDPYKLMRDMMNDCEQRSQEMEERIGRAGIYSRFSVEQGMQNDHPGQTADPGWITTQTESYLSGQHACNKLEIYANAKIGSINLDHLKHVGSSDEPSQLSTSVRKSLGILISNHDDATIEKLKPPDLECGSHVSECLEGTRQDILTRIDAWVMETDAPNILWINGYPGIGKSAIATSIVERWRSSGRLGSSFFFRRDGADVMTPHSLWRVIAYDLGRHYSTIRKHLVALLNENDTSHTTSNIDKLFRELIHDPLVASSDIPTERLPIIVIDALDECGGLEGRYSDNRKGLMRTLKSWSGLPSKFKLVVTSRRESDIKQGFAGINHRSLSIIAGQGTSSQSSEDIQTFLRHELRQIVSLYPSMSPDWPGEKIICSLTNLASGLFIWVKTVLKLLERGELERTLKQILSGAGGMASLYQCILNSSFPSPSNEDIIDFRSIVGAIIFAKTPLDAMSLAHLLSISSSAIGYVCNGLHSVLENGETLRIHHQSFVDFLLDPEECPTPFLIDQQRANKTLTMACLHTMKRHLRFNICDLKSSYIRNQDIPDLDSRIQALIPGYLSYSSCHWAGHLTETGFNGDVYEALEHFMSFQFLFWLEVLSLVQQVNIGSGMLRLLVDWVKRFGQDETLAMDMRKFVVAFASVISQSVPHIYISALPFAPRHLGVSKQYMASHPRTLSIRRGGYTNWPAIQSVFNGHTAWVNSVSFSPDGTRIVSGSGDNTIRVWDAETGETVVGPLEGHTNSVNSVSFSPDGRRIVSGSSDYTIQVWDAETGESVVGPLEGHDGFVNAVSFSPDGTRIVSGSDDRSIWVWDAKTGETVMGPLESHAECVNSVSFSPDGSKIVSGSFDNTIRVWDAQTGETLMKSIQSHDGCINSVSFSSDGTRIVSGSFDSTIRIWDAETGETVVGPLKGHNNLIWSVSFSPNGTRIVSASSDNTIRVWDAETGETLMETLEDHLSCSWVMSVSFSPDGTRLVSGSSDKTIQVWNAEPSETVMGPLKGYISPVMSVSFSPDGTCIVSGFEDSTIRVWNTETGETVLGPLKGHQLCVNSVTFSPDGSRIVSGSSDDTIRLWNAETGETVMEPLEGHNGCVNTVSFSPDGSHIVSGSDDRTVRIWDAKTGKTVRLLGGHSDRVMSVSFSPNGTHIVSGSWNKTIQIWDVKTGETVIRPLEGHEGCVNTVSFSPNGTRIVSGSSDRTIRVWDVETGETIVWPMNGHSEYVNSVSFSPDGKRIVSGSDDKTVRVWDAETGEIMMGPLEGHTDLVGSVSFSPDGKYIASGSDDGTIRLWDAQTGERMVDPLESYINWVNSVSSLSHDTHAISGFEGHIKPAIKLQTKHSAVRLFNFLRNDTTDA
ncbi:hypothetical protein M408DRAFT_31025 [Serendipita vermifera MAFF 305830]|uniref:PNPLA domain-containing protein n=1 Tax=Serendipita vermifera MAFF 305830 TaxID=933852 RepID=A0A0C3A4T0_SERVB|nr:hypothetical protein M408DRAFT_31025 [Serendipita vermifera MAFF 305830]